MAINVDIPTVLRSFTGNKKRFEVNGGDVSQVIDDIENKYPGVKNRLISDGQLNRYINIFVNDEDIRFVKSLQTEVKEGDLITILPAVAGG